MLDSNFFRVCNKNSNRVIKIASLCLAFIKKIIFVKLKYLNVFLVF